MNDPSSTYFFGRIGLQNAGEGVSGPSRLGRNLELITGDAHGRYHEAVRTQNVFSLCLPLTATGIAAGNLVGATAAAAVQFALWNPIGSGKLLSLLKFGMGIVSGTPVGGPLFHGLLSTIPSIATTNTGGVALNNYAAGPLPVAKYVNTAAQSGTALTAAGAVLPLRVANFTSTATAQASVGMVNAVEELAGDIILPPGTGWIPLWATAGTSVLNGYSVTWEEIVAS